MPAVVAESSLIQLDRSLHMSMNADAVPPSHSLPPDEYRIGAQQQGMGGRPAYGGERMQYSDAGHEASQVNHIGGHGVWQQSHLPGLISGPSPLLPPPLPPASCRRVLCMQAECSIALCAVLEGYGLD
eukprot:TRINITY_DN13244_c0_g1_i3.p1 TRINITY_DN13244_c0_g1~~TRINITY_DN13244_c0_g1_i3.p1  ORF type:complete len:128 (+),score=6.04 TRINITY_DN13244_c0_g1_i3:233-616(+)